MLTLNTTNAAWNIHDVGKENSEFSESVSPVEVNRAQWTLLTHDLAYVALRDSHAILCGHHYEKLKSNISDKNYVSEDRWAIVSESCSEGDSDSNLLTLRVLYNVYTTAARFTSVSHPHNFMFSFWKSTEFNLCTVFKRQ